MMDRLLRYNTSVIWLLLGVLALKLCFFLLGQTNSGGCDGLLSVVMSLDSLWSGLLAGFISVVFGVLILLKNDRYAKQVDFSYWIVLLLVLLFNFYGFYGFTGEYIGVAAVIASQYFLDRNLGLNNDSGLITNSFNLSLVLGLGIMFTPCLVYLLPMFWIIYVILGVYSFRSILASVIGLALPYLVIDACVFSLGLEGEYVTSSYLLENVKSTSLGLNVYDLQWNILACVGPAVLLFTCLYFMFTQSRDYKLIIRRFNMVNLILFFYLGVMILMGLIPMHYGCLLLVLPIVYFLSNAKITVKTKNVFTMVVLISMLISYPPIINEIVSWIEMIF